MNNEDIKLQIRQILTNVVPEAKDEEIDPHVALRDQFDIDSLDFLNFVLALEKEFEVKVPETAYPRFGSLDGAVSYLASLLAEKVA